MSHLLGDVVAVQKIGAPLLIALLKFFYNNLLTMPCRHMPPHREGVLCGMRNLKRCILRN